MPLLGSGRPAAARYPKDEVHSRTASSSSIVRLTQQNRLGAGHGHLQPYPQARLLPLRRWEPEALQFQVRLDHRRHLYYIYPTNQGLHLPKSSSLDLQTHQLVKTSWEVEAPTSDVGHISAEDQQAMDYFKGTQSRDSDGCYMVKLPNKSPALELGCSRI